MTDIQQVNVFLPCRKGSERVKNKNTRPFNDFQNGLVEIKLAQLIASKHVSRVYLSTNDERILDYVGSLGYSKIYLHSRSEELSSSLTSTDSLVSHALDLIGEGHILWTHVTSPFISSDIYDELINQYFSKKKLGFDSLMTTSTVHSFLWNDHGPVNYSRATEKWPRTQTLQALHEINSGVFLASAEIYEKLGDRIGSKPYLHALDRICGFDIDWEADFQIAQAMLLAGIAKL